MAAPASSRDAVTGGRRHLAVVPSTVMEAGSTTVEPPEQHVTRCSSCMAAIFFGETSGGARSPYDVYPRVKGPWRVVGATDEGVPRMMYDPSQQAGVMPPGEGYVTHWLTCPSARDHRPATVSPRQLSLAPDPEE